MNEISPQSLSLNSATDTGQAFSRELLHGYRIAKTALENPTVDAGIAAAALVVGTIAFRGKGEAALTEILPDISLTTESSAAGGNEAVKAAATSKGKIIYFDRDLLDPSLPEQSTILRDVFRADQSDAAHSKSFEGYTKLAQATSRFVGTNLEPQFHHALSFESFHMGQFQALQLKAPEEALASFEKSLQHADDARRSYLSRGNLNEGDWINYVRGTVAYMKGDIQEVATSKAIETDVINKFKLANFEDGLRMHGSPDYLRDYCKPNPS